MPTDPILDTVEFTALDRHLARLLVRLDRSNSPLTALTAGLLSAYARQGHVCLNLRRLAGSPLPPHHPFGSRINCPGYEEWSTELARSSVVGTAGQFQPLVRSGDRVYFYRYWDYENDIVRFIRSRAADATFDIPINPRLLRDLFTPAISPDWQLIAALSVLSRRFSAITGGPGTGKTSTVVKILALILDREVRGPAPRIALAAPTGKAANRLARALSEARAALRCDERIRKALPGDVTTIHRLLGFGAGSPAGRFNERNPLPCDMLVIDEASMVDTALMAKTVRALAPQARLVLVGDRNQLASVDPGSVLADVCGHARQHAFSKEFREYVGAVSGTDAGAIGEDSSTPQSLTDCVVTLRQSHRFAQESGIGRLSEAVNAGDAAGALSILNSGAFGDLRIEALPAPSRMEAALRSSVIDEFEPVLRAQGPGEALTRAESFRILCAVRTGPYGVEGVNRSVERVLAAAGLIRPADLYYPGRPVLITRNSYSLELFNGDTGLILRSAEARGEPRAFFPSSKEGVRAILPHRLPPHETAYATTVHKSQGSEFERVLLILPDTASPVLTRELLYTAITRARNRCTIWSREAVLTDAIGRVVRRESGLGDALWGPQSG